MFNLDFHKSVISESINYTKRTVTSRVKKQMVGNKAIVSIKKSAVQNIDKLQNQNKKNKLNNEICQKAIENRRENYISSRYHNVKKMFVVERKK